MTKPPHQPSAFLQGPSLHPQPQQARVVEVRPVPVRAPEPLSLTVSPRGRVYLSRQLCIHLGLRHGQSLELVPPIQRNGGKWHLLVPPEANAPLPTLTLHIDGNYKPQFDCRHVLSPTRFKRRTPAKGSGKGGGQKGELLSLLTLELDPDTLTTTGFLPLRPVYALST